MTYLSKWDSSIFEEQSLVLALQIPEKSALIRIELKRRYHLTDKKLVRGWHYKIEGKTSESIEINSKL